MVIIDFLTIMKDLLTGPFDLNALKQMSASGQFSADSLVWKDGMAEWMKARDVEELKVVFGGIPPIPRGN